MSKNTSNLRKINNSRWGLKLLILPPVLMGVTAISVKAIAQPVAKEIKVGIVQRFGDEQTEQLQLEAVPGDRLTLSFPTGTKPQTLQATKVTLEVTMQPLPQSVLSERV